MSSIPSSSSSSPNPLAALASQLFTGADNNRDGHLSATEFQTFLEGLLKQINTRQTTGLGSAASAAKLGASRSYQGMMGFDYVKLNTPSHTTPKYVFARATQDIELGWDRPSRSAGLQQIVDNVKQNGYPEARVIGDDTIDFGDGAGEIDVLTGDGQWWWGPKR